MITKHDVPADKEAMFVCSFVCAGMDSLLKQEPRLYTARARKIVTIIEQTKKLMDMYPGQVTKDMLDLAAALFDKLEAEAHAKLREASSSEQF